MSYTLQDLLRELQQQQQQQQPQRGSRAQRQRVAPQAAEFPPQYFSPSYGQPVFSPYGYGYAPFGYYDGEDDDQSEDQYTSSRYPDYYFNPYAGRRAQQYVRPPQQQVPLREEDDDGTASNIQLNSLEDLLDLLSGGAVKPSGGSEEAAEAPKGASEVEAAKVAGDQPKSEALESEAPKSEAPKNEAPKNEAPKEEKPKAEVKTPAPLKKRHSHSTANFKEPAPTVEISQRNVKNSALPYSPQTNLYESEKEYTLILAIPGAQLKDLDIDFHPSLNEIVIKGTIPDPIADATGVKVNEIKTGSIERRVKFPTFPKIDDDNIKAKYFNGLLTIKVPKVEETEKPKLKKVTIEDVPDEELEWEEHGGVVE